MQTRMQPLHFILKNTGGTRVNAVYTWLMVVSRKHYGSIVVSSSDNVRQQDAQCRPLVVFTFQRYTKQTSLKTRKEKVHVYEGLARIGEKRCFGATAQRLRNAPIESTVVGGFATDALVINRWILHQRRWIFGIGGQRCEGMRDVSRLYYTTEKVTDMQRLRGSRNG